MIPDHIKNLPGWPVEPEVEPLPYLPAAVLQTVAPYQVQQPIAVQGSRLLHAYAQPIPQPAPERDPWPARMAGGGILAAGSGVGVYFFGLGVHAAGYGLWAVAVIAVAMAWMRASSGGRRGAVNVSVRIDNRNR